MRLSSIDLEVLRFIVTAAQAGKLSRAAKLLGVEPATLSRKIAAAENELGLTFFERSNSGVRVTAGARNLLIYAERVMADVDAFIRASRLNAAGEVGQIRVGIRMPTVGQPAQTLLKAWRDRHPHVELILHEMNERDLMAAIGERRLDVAFMTKHTLWPDAVAVPLWREPILAAFARGHRLGRRKAIKWEHLREETLLVQGWEESQTAREFYASFLGSGTRYSAHAASKLSVLSLVSAGAGITLVTESQAEVHVPGIVTKPITEDNAWVEVELVWVPENEETVVGRFVAFMRDEARSRKLV
jgi:DNA-binding transcriptional LysR family regulator